jgi:hypothetical protein
MKKLLFMIFSVFIFSFSIIQGCSLIGLGIGHANDKSKKNYFDSLSDFLLLEKDKIYRITLKSGEIDSARFMGFDKLTDDEYQIRYNQSRVQIQDSLPLPEFGEIITFVIDEKRTAVKFKGFNANYVLIQIDDEKEPIRQKYKFIKSSLIQDSQNNVIELSEVEELILQRKIALLSTASFETKQGIIKIPLDEILRVDFDSKKYGAAIGFLTGAIIDGLIIYGLATFEYEMNFKERQ